MEPHVSRILSTSQLLCINLCGIHQLHGYKVANKAHTYIPVASQLHACIPVAMYVAILYRVYVCSGYSQYPAGMH